MRSRYTAIEEGIDNQEKYLEVGKKTSEEMHYFLQKGTNKLKVQRFGTGTDTMYRIIPAA